MDIAAHALTGALIGRSLAPSAALEGPLCAFGAVAACLPDLDMLTELRGKLAAWRFHRVALHGIAIAAPLAVAAAAIANLTVASSAGFERLCLISLLAVASHLVLDVLTSFGTALLFPFSRRRFTTRTHFIVDPYVWAILAWAFFTHHDGWGLLLLAGEIALVWLVRAAMTAHVKRLEPSLTAARMVLEPRFFAPWSWLVIAPHNDRGYWLADLCLWWVSPRGVVDHGGEHGGVAKRDALLEAFLETCDFPIFHRQDSESGEYLVVEDAKWWLHPPFRPLAFSARINSHGIPMAPRQTGIWQVGLPSP